MGGHRRHAVRPGCGGTLRQGGSATTTTTTLHSTTRHCTTLRYTTLHDTKVDYTTTRILHYTILFYITLQLRDVTLITRHYTTATATLPYTSLFDFGFAAAFSHAYVLAIFSAPPSKLACIVVMHQVKHGSITTCCLLCSLVA